MSIYDDEYDEYYDDEPYFEEPGGGAWTHTELRTNPDGSITGITTTNDNLDRGYPTEFASWPERFANIEALAQRYPRRGEWTGISGIEVTITLDGEIWDPKKARVAA